MATKSTRLELYKTRNIGGFGAAATVAVGFVAAVWIATSATLVMTAYKKNAEFKYRSVVRSSAEAGLDYVVAQLNQSCAQGTSCAYDDLVTDGAPKTSALSSSIIGNAANVTVAVNNIAPTSTSSVYDPLLDPPSPEGTGALNSTVTSNQWKMVEATATYAGLSKTVRVALRPTYETIGAIPLFPLAAFANGVLNGAGNMRTDSYDSRNGTYGGSNVDNYNGSIGSNTRIELGGNTIIGGNVLVSSLPKGSTTMVSATRSSNARITNQLKVNGVATGFSALVGPSPGGSDNVLASEHYLPPALRSGDYTTPIDSSQSLDQVGLVAAPNSPGDSINIGAISVSGNARVIVRNGSPAPSGSISVGGNSTIYIPPGNYKASSLNVSGNGQIVVESNVTLETKVFIEGNSPGSTVVQISGNGVANNTAIPAKFQILTNSSKNISISGNGNFYGTIYAPSANISVSGNGHVYGALVSNNATIGGNGMLHFDKALQDSTYAQAVGLSRAGQPILTGFKTITWQEL